MTNQIRRSRRIHPLPLALLAFAACLTSGLAADSVRAATFGVNSDGDASDLIPGDAVCATGQLTPVGAGFAAECTLRAALEEANALAGTDTIRFTADVAIGIAEIRPATPLPAIVDPVHLDGYSTPGYDAADPWATPLIGLDGQALSGAAGLAFRPGSDGSRVRGLAIYGFDDGIEIGPGGLVGDGPASIEIEGCQIGVRSGGVYYPGNLAYGIEGMNVLSTKLGKRCDATTCEGKGNVIAASGIAGISVVGSGVEIQGNRIGTNVGGTSLAGPFGDPTPNGLYGVRLELGRFNLVGGSLPEAGNLISGSQLAGVVAGESDNRIQWNSLGTRADGTGSLTNQHAGIYLFDGNNDVLDNLIAGGGTAGVIDEGDGNRITGNTIGLSADQTAQAGIFVTALDLRGQGTIVSGNTIGGSAFDDVLVAGDDITLVDNWIGTTAAALDFGTAQRGIRVEGDRVTIGAIDGGNVLGFHGDEIVLDEGSNDGLVIGNWIGVHPDGTPIGAASEGIEVRGASHTIGGLDGTTNGEANVIGFNVDGIEIFGTALDTSIHGNFIGTDASGADLGNSDNGIDLTDSIQSYVGAYLGVGDAVARRLGNAIAHNGGVGVAVTGDAAQANTVRANSFFGNGFGPVDLQDDGHTPNDPNDQDAGPNRLMNFPEIDAAGVSIDPGTGDLDVRYRVLTNASFVSFPLTVDFYLSTGNDGQPNAYFGSARVESFEAGTWQTETLPASPDLYPQGLLLANMTDADGNSSEFTNQFIPLPEPGTAVGLAVGALLLHGLGQRRRGTRRMGSMG